MVIRRDSYTFVKDINIQGETFVVTASCAICKCDLANKPFVLGIAYDGQNPVLVKHFDGQESQEMIPMCKSCYAKYGVGTGPGLGVGFDSSGLQTKGLPWRSTYRRVPILIEKTGCTAEVYDAKTGKCKRLKDHAVVMLNPRPF